MTTRIYRFGRFRLNPQARELFDGASRINLPISTIDCLTYLIAHRDRPVGRDELAAAVWGRVDVSEVSLSHAVMRLRRLLGDTGNEQRVIRTVPRLGYRWVMDVAEEIDADTASALPATTTEDIEASVPGTTPAQSRRPPRVAIALAAVIGVGALLLVMFMRPRTQPTRETGQGKPLPAIVLPVTLDAPPDSVWVRLGVMDLVATELRRGGIATMPSETVVALANAHDGTAPLPGQHALIVQPSATFARDGWRIRLDARDAQRTLKVEAHADDPVKAGRKAADELLIKLGHVPPETETGDAALAQTTLRQRVNAAVLSGQLDVARNLIRDAAPALKASPEIALSEAKLAFYGGNYRESRERIETLLAQLPQDAQPALRARALNTIGAAYFREGRIEEADKAYAESIRLADHGGPSDVLANAYIGSGGVASQRMQLDEAATDYGRARTLLDLGNDAFGVAAVDLNLGMISLQRGQPAAALPILRGAAQRFEQLASEDALAATRVAIVDADLAVLDYADALATSAQLAPLQSRGGNARQRWEPLLARARALAGVGRLAEADTLLARIADGSDPQQDAVPRAQANVLGADIALDRGDCVRAAELAQAAAISVLETAIPADYARAMRSLARGLRCSGHADAAAEQVGKLHDWSAGAPGALAGLEVMLAAAERAGAAGADREALDRYAEAMRVATQRAIPDEIAAVALPYVRSLLAAGRIDEAVSVNGQTAGWADRDARAALIQALVYAALKNASAADAAFERARRLAGERVFAELAAPRDRTAGP